MPVGMLLKSSDTMSLQKLAEVGVWKWNTETGHMYWSDIMFDIHGLSP